MSDDKLSALHQEYDVAAGPWASGGNPKGPVIDWENARRVHDWRNHVPEVIAHAWPLLDEQARVVAFLMASKMADAEEWD